MNRPLLPKPKHLRIIFFAIALFIAISLVYSVWLITHEGLPERNVAFPNGVMRVGMDTGYPPFALDTGEGLQGIDVQLAEAISDQIGIPMQIIPISFDGLYDALTADRVDVVISALLIDSRRTEDVRYTQHYFDSGLLFVTTNQMPGSYDDLTGARIAFEFGSVADGIIRQQARRVTDVTLLPYETPNYALDALRFGDANAAVVDAITYALYEVQHTDWQPNVQSITHAPYAIAVRLDRIEVYRLVQNALEIIVDSNLLDDIIQQGIAPQLSAE